MARKLDLIPYTLVTMASICLMSGLLVLTGGESKHGENRENIIYDRQCVKN
jgi:uncharacterized protein YuzB (UPF0349 family)